MSSKIIIPKDYKPVLDFFSTEKAIKLVKDTFEKKLAQQLNLTRISAPRFLIKETGMQDDLAGTQNPVSFKTKFTDSTIEIVHSLAKWKRHVLGKYNFKPETGLYTDMDAIRKDEDVDATHSIYVDQWDWEKIITKEDRTLSYLKKIVRQIYSVLLETEATIEKKFPILKSQLTPNITFIHTEELEKEYPKLSPQERESAITKKHGAVFLIGIGHTLKSGKPHDIRAADYDDWSTSTSTTTTGLNGDILVWNNVRKEVLELSSMGIRVDAKALLKQVKIMKKEYILKFNFHKQIIKNKLPLSVGGGIGQSRLCLYLLQKAHIGEVQSSIWTKEVINTFAGKNISLL